MEWKQPKQTPVHCLEAHYSQGNHGVYKLELLYQKGKRVCGQGKSALNPLGRALSAGFATYQIRGKKEKKKKKPVESMEIKYLPYPEAS